MKILIISLSNLGDAILTTPAIHALREKHPQAVLHVLASERTRELFEKDPIFSRVWIWDKKAFLAKQILLIGRLFGQRFDWVVDFRQTLIPLFLFPKRRTPIWRTLLDRRIHRKTYHLSLVGSLGVTAGSGTARLAYAPADEAWALEKIRSGKRLVVLAPGARSHLKRWSAERFAEVADRLIEERSAQVVLVGGPEDAPQAAEVALQMKHPAVDLAGKTTLAQLFALLSRAALVITNDSACLHAAQAQGIPTVAIFGPTDENKYGPTQPGSVVVRRRLVCAPCEQALCAYGHECLQLLETEPVYSAAARILKESDAQIA